jgi:hypothetical protein
VQLIKKSCAIDASLLFVFWYEKRYSEQIAQYVEIWQRDDQDIAAWHYRHYGPGEIVELNSIGVQIDIANVYQGLDFAEAETETGEE